MSESEPEVVGEFSEERTETKPDLSPQEKARLWREWAASNSRDTPPLSDYVVSRFDISGGTHLSKACCL